MPWPLPPEGLWSLLCRHMTHQVESASPMLLFSFTRLLAVALMLLSFL